MERSSTDSPWKKTSQCDIMQNESWKGDDEQILIFSHMRNMRQNRNIMQNVHNKLNSI